MGRARRAVGLMHNAPALAANESGAGHHTGEKMTDRKVMRRRLLAAGYVRGGKTIVVVDGRGARDSTSAVAHVVGGFGVRCAPSAAAIVERAS